MLYALAFMLGLFIGRFFWMELITAFRFVVWWMATGLLMLIGVFRYLWRSLINFWYNAIQRLAKSLDTLRKKLIILAVVLFYILWAASGIMLLVAAGVLATAAGYGIATLTFIALLVLLVAFLLADFGGKVAAALASIAILATVLWVGLTSFFGSIGGALLAFWNSAGNFFAGLMKGTAAILAGVSIGLPSCTERTPTPPVVTPILPRVVVGQPLTPSMMIQQTLIAKKGEGCMRISERGGLPLTLAECKTLSLDAGREVIVKKKRIMAPVVALKEVWYLVKEGDRVWWIIN